MPESSIIIEYLAQHYPGRSQLVPADPDLARQTRLRDRFYDLYVQEPMQKVVTDRLRPAGAKDPFGVEQARALLRTAYGMIEQDMARQTWAMGDAFSMADCAAAPALFYANLVEPFETTHGHAARYLGRPDGAPVVRPRRRGSAALFRAVPAVARDHSGDANMRFMMIVKASKESEAGVMPSEELLTAMGKYNEELVNAGVMRAGEGLHPSAKGARVRFSGERRTVTNGPFPELQQLIAGFWLIEVGSLEEAIDWAKRCPNPMAGESEIEIRQVFEAEDFGEALTPELRQQEEQLRARSAAQR